jgi:hypothetical protein
MMWWVYLFAASLVIRQLCVSRMRRNKRAEWVSRNTRPVKTGPRYEQDRPYPECFDDL